MRHAVTNEQTACSQWTTNANLHVDCQRARNGHSAARLRVEAGGHVAAARAGRAAAAAHALEAAALSQTQQLDHCMVAQRTSDHIVAFAIYAVTGHQTLRISVIKLMHAAYMYQ